MHLHRVRPRHDSSLCERARRSQDQLIRGIAQAPPTACHAELGEVLFELAFPDQESRIRLADDLATAVRNQTALRIVIQSGDPEWNGLFWEYLCLPEPAVEHFRNCGVKLESRFLALHPHCGILRQGRGTAQRRPMERLRVLVAWANPETPVFPDDPSIENEGARVRSCLDELGRAFVEVRELAGAQAEELFQAIGDFKPHVVHVCSHGHHPDFTAASGGPPEPALVFGRDGVAEFVTAQELTDACGQATVAVVILNCCFMAHAQGLASSFAERLLAASDRPPLVIAHQTPITEASAVKFVHSLHKALALGQTVDGAVAQFRRELAAEHALGSGTPDLGVPVLYAPEGELRLFEPTVNDPYPIDFGELFASYQFFVGRKELQERILGYVENLRSQRRGGLYLITAEPGLGLQQVQNRLRQRPADQARVWAA